MSSYTRVYTVAGTVAHLLDFLLSPNQPNSALCGRSPWPELWHGTGTQDEEERAADLTLCTGCASIQRHRNNGELIR